VERPAKRCYVGLVTVGVQEQAEDILVPPLLRNCLTLMAFLFLVVISPPQNSGLYNSFYRLGHSKMSMMVTMMKPVSRFRTLFKFSNDALVSYTPDLGQFGHSSHVRYLQDGRAPVLRPRTDPSFQPVLSPIST